MNTKKERALLISVYEQHTDKRLCEEHLDELALLLETYGGEAVEKFPCYLRRIDASTFMTSGKLEEAKVRAEALGVDLILFDDEISPSQGRNLEKIFGRPVIDRTELILRVFSQRAHSKEAHLQVELASLRYHLPRLTRMWTHLHRQAGTAGAGAYLKGAGEKQIELDRRALKRRIGKLQKEIEVVTGYRETQRRARKRSGIPTFALIGYTNAGKSTLLNALTEADVFVEDKLFATLDTTTRKFTLPSHQEILIVDTVGFIRKLPHLLIAAFKSTLQEAVETDILLHVIDASHPAAAEHVRASLDVLKELKADKKPMITLLNKVDRCEDEGSVKRLRVLCPHSIAISATERRGFDELQEAMMEELKKWRREIRLRIPQSEYQLVSQLKAKAHVIEESYEENDVLLEVELPALMAEQFKVYIDDTDSGNSTGGAATGAP